jgi:hypothetical protein
MIPAMEIAPVDTRAGQAFPGLLRVKIRLPKRKGSALEGPVFINSTAVLPENTVKIRLFFQRKLLTASGSRNPPAIGFHKDIILYFESSC